MALSIFVKSVLARVIFFSHAFFAIYIVVSIKNDVRFWWLSFILILLLIESIVTILFRKSKEYKWYVYGYIYYNFYVIFTNNSTYKSKYMC